MNIETMGLSRRDFFGIAGVAGAFLLGMPGPAATALEQATPSAKRICLIPETYIAGTTHVSGIERVVETLCVGDELVLERDPDNPYDCWAIRILDGCGKRVGFVRRVENEMPARLMDGGLRLFAVVTGIELINAWYKISIELWLEA